MLSGFLAPWARVSGTEKLVTITGGYETREGGSFELEFRGPVPDAQPVKEFLEPQLRDASSKNLEANFQLTFASRAFPCRATRRRSWPSAYARFASGAAYVSATAEAKA